MQLDIVIPCFNEEEVLRSTPRSNYTLTRIGGPLEWESLEGTRACRIKKKIVMGGWQDEEKWPETHDAMIDAMISIERALRPHLKQIKVGSVR